MTSKAERVRRKTDSLVRAIMSIRVPGGSISIKELTENKLKYKYSKKVWKKEG